MCAVEVFCIGFNDFSKSENDTKSARPQSYSGGALKFPHMSDHALGLSNGCRSRAHSERQLAAPRAAANFTPADLANERNCRPQPLRRRLPYICGQKMLPLPGGASRSRSNFRHHRPLRAISPIGRTAGYWRLLNNCRTRSPPTPASAAEHAMHERAALRAPASNIYALCSVRARRSAPRTRL